MGSALALGLFAVADVRTAAAQASEPSENDKAMHYSLYYENYKNSNFEAALPDLRWILENAPTYFGPGRVSDRNFERGIELYDSLAARAEDETLRRAHLDSALALYDRIVPTVKNAGGEINEQQWLVRKGRFIQSHPEALADLQSQVGDIYRAAYDLNPKTMDPYSVQVIVAHIVQRGDKETAVDFMDDVETHFGENADVMGYVTQVRNSLFTSPDERIAFLEGRLQKSPDDMELVSELFKLYRETGMRDKQYQLGDKLLQMEPTPQVYRMLATMRLEDGEPGKAIELYDRAMAMPGFTATANDYYNLGIAYQEQGNLSRARSQFRKALEVDSGFGRAYIAIGDLYATAVRNCGAMEREDRAVYWLVVDYYDKARSVDPSVASVANQKASTYRQYFPDQEALFFKGWQAGQSFNINYGCYAWIGETTRVRTP